MIQSGKKRFMHRFKSLLSGKGRLADRTGDRCVDTSAKFFQIEQLEPRLMLSGTIYYTNLFQNDITSIDVDGANSQLVFSNDDSPRDLEYSQSTDQIFFANVVSVDRVDADGSNELDLAVRGTNGIPSFAEFDSVALDHNHNYVFWGDQRGGLYRSDFDGGNLLDMLPSNALNVGGLDYHDGNNVLYFGTKNNQIYQINYDGTGLVNLNVSSPGNVQGLVIDEANSHIYWADLNSDAIYRSDLDGMNKTTILDGLDDPRYLDIDPVAGRIYWAESAYHTSGQDNLGKVRQSDLDGNHVRDIVTELEFAQGIDFVQNNNDADISVSMNGQMIVSNASTPLQRYGFGETVQLELLVSNDGHSPLFTGAVNALNGFSVLNSLPFQINSGEYVTLSIEVDTSVIGELSGDLTIQSSDPDEGVFVLPLDIEVVPVALDDFYQIPEDTELVAGIVSHTLIAAETEWEFIDQINNGGDGNPVDDYPVDANGLNFNQVGYDINTSDASIGTWSVGQSPFASGSINGFGIYTELAGRGDVNGGSNSVTTHLFRKEFNASIDIHTLLLDYLFDDGAIVYLNGNEIFRTDNLVNVQAGTNEYTNGVGVEDYADILIDVGGVMVGGTNLIAVELHQQSDTTSDFGMDLRVTGFSGTGDVEGVLSNDSGGSEAEILNQPEHGEIQVNNDGAFVYVPDLNFHGTDSFTYQAANGNIVSEPAFVTIEVMPVNDPPVVINPVPDQTAIVGIPYEYELPNDVFFDVDGDELIISAYLTKLMGQYGQQQILATSSSPSDSLFIKDLDSDGDVDVLFAERNIVGWIENLGDGVFSSVNVINSSLDYVQYVHADDIDDDGDIDIASASYDDNTIAWFENLGDGNYGAPVIVSSTESGARQVLIVDLDGDELNDLLTVSEFNDSVSWFRNLGNGDFAGKQNITTQANGALRAHASDLDNDGDVDILSSSLHDNKIAWYENLGGGAFGAQQVISTAADGPWGVVAGDLNKDGLLDVVSASARDDKIAWYENLGNGQFGTQAIISANADRARSVRSVDVDLDGDLDILSASLEDNKIAWFENVSSGSSWIEHIISNQAFSARDVGFGDLNGDGVFDVVSSAAGNTQIAWYENLLTQGYQPLQGWLAFDGVDQILSGVPTAQDIGTLNLALLATDQPINSEGWVETFDNGVGRFTIAEGHGDEVFVHDQTEQDLNAAFLRRDINQPMPLDIRAAELDATYSQDDILTYSFDWSPDSVTGNHAWPFIGLFDENLEIVSALKIGNDGADTYYEILYPDGSESSRPSLGFSSPAWVVGGDYHLEVVLNGPENTVQLMAYEIVNGNYQHMHTTPALAFADVEYSIQHVGVRNLPDDNANSSRIDLSLDNFSFASNLYTGLYEAVSDVFSIEVLANTPPSAETVTDQQVMEDVPFIIQLSADTFIDSDVGDELAYSATLANGDSLPDFITFDAGLFEFGGIGEQQDVGEYLIRVSATDLGGNVVHSDFTLEVLEVNDPPQPSADAYIIQANQSFIIDQLSGVLSNDYDEEGGLAVELVQQTMNGEVSLNADGSFSYEPDLNFYGIDSFTYQVVDQEIISDPVVVEITVTPPHDFDDDGDTDAEDISQMQLAVFLWKAGLGGDLEKYDLSGDDQINDTDMDILIHQLFETEYGDANLDGKVNLEDLAKLATNFDQTNVGWGEGDFTGDREVDLSDLAKLATNYGFNGAGSGSGAAEQLVIKNDELENSDQGALLVNTDARFATNDKVLAWEHIGDLLNDESENQLV